MFVRQKILLAIAVVLVLFSNSSYSKGISTTIEKIDARLWSVTFQASKPVSRIAFQRNPDGSRVNRWRPEDNNFKLIFDDGKEFILRKDGSKFIETKLFLTPTHHRFVKDYAAFSPFSDGGALIHSGRFFACENDCETSENEWSLSINVPRGEHIILNGELFEANVSWSSSNSGEKLYVGVQKPIVTNGFVSIVDTNLPEKLKNSFDAYIPELTAYFEAKLGAVSSSIKPTLYVSYSPTKGPSIRGGVLPGQIFIHLDDDDLEKFSSNEIFLNDLLWTLAHEIAHYFQGFGALKIESNESWIHEGHAEILAYDAISHLYPSLEKYIDIRARGFEEKCIKALEVTSLNDAASTGQFGAYYACGFLIYKAASDSGEREQELGTNPYKLWNDFSSVSRKDKKTSEQIFIEVLTELRGEKLAHAISQFINVKHSNSMRAVKALINNE